MTRTPKQKAASKRNLEKARQARIHNKLKMNRTKRVALEATAHSSKFPAIRSHYEKRRKLLTAMLTQKPVGKRIK